MKISLQPLQSTPSYIKKRNMPNLNDVYGLLGVSNQAVSKWRYTLSSAESKKQFKHTLIIRAGVLFELTQNQAEVLANKAGLSLHPYFEAINRTSPKTATDSLLEADAELFPYCESRRTDILAGNDPSDFERAEFIHDFNALISAYPGKMTELCFTASVSDRMLRHIKKGQHLKKEPLLALLIALEQSLDNIQALLKKAGYILSGALPNDTVIMWVLENEGHHGGANRLNRINDILDSLELPLLMTRTK